MVGGGGGGGGKARRQCDGGKRHKEKREVQFLMRDTCDLFKALPVHAISNF